MVELVGVDFVLEAIGFDTAVQRGRIREAGLNDFDDSVTLWRKTFVRWRPSSESVPRHRDISSLVSGAPRS